MHRRKFVQIGAAAAFGVAVASRIVSGSSPNRFKKALKYDMVETDGSVREKFALLKELGFDGVEMYSPSDLDQQEVREAKAATGLAIPGVVDSAHWQMTLSDPDAAVRAKGVEALRTALRDAQAYGASTVLLVPAVVNKTVSYDDAYRRSQAEIRKVLPEAEALGVRIAIENVWNGFLLSPLEFARYIDEFESEWIGAHFDIGNIVNFGWPEQWIRVLGPRILKLDVKEFSRSRRDQEGLWKGFEVGLGEGDVDWPAVVEALEEIDYSGWAAAEIPGGDRERLADIVRRMNNILS